MRIIASLTTCLALAILFGYCQRNASTQTGGNNGQSGKIAISRSQNPMFAYGKAETEIDGNLAKAFLIAYDAFKNEDRIPLPKKQLENYVIEYRQDKSTYFVYFKAKTTPGENPQAGGETRLGVDVTYAVIKSDFHVVARQFYK